MSEENGNGRKTNPNRRALLLRETGSEGYELLEVFAPDEDYKSPVSAAKAFLKEVYEDTGHELNSALKAEQLIIVAAKDLEPVRVQVETREVARIQ